jgi:hypothetical protein
MHPRALIAHASAVAALRPRAWQATAKCPQLAWSECSVWVPDQHRSYCTRTG